MKNRLAVNPADHHFANFPLKIRGILAYAKQKVSPIAFFSYCLILFGIILRIRQYFSFRSLWLDEAMLALNIVNRDLVGLLKPLDYNQGAPLGFLLVEKLVTQVFGTNELTLRLFPLASGCAALLLLYFLVNKILNPAGILAALALFAVSPNLIYYSSEVKQYSTDVFIFLLLLWIAFVVVKNDTGELRYKILLALAGVIALFFSHPALFILSSIGVVLLLDKIIRRDRAGVISILIIGLIWIITFGIIYFVSLRYLSSNSFLINYWNNYFSLNPLDGLLALFHDPGGFDANTMGLLIISAIGMIVLFIRNWKLAGTFILILLFTFIASWLQKYPFAGRLMLFSMPILGISLATTVDWISKIQIRPRFIFIAFSTILIAWMLYSPLSESASIFIHPQYVEHIRPAMSYLQTNYEQGDVIYVYSYSVPAFRYYAPIYGLSESAFIAGEETGLTELKGAMGQLKSHSRVWLIFSHIPRNGLIKLNALLSYLDTLGKLKEKYTKSGTGVYLYLYDLK